MKRSLAFVYVLGVFLLGGTIGALGMHLYQAKTVSNPNVEGRRPPGGMAIGGRGMPRGFRIIDGRFDLSFLELTAEQADRIDAIRKEAREEMDAVRRELRPRMEQHVREKRASIDEVLTEEQRAKLDEYLERRQPHGRGQRRGPPPEGR